MLADLPPSSSVSRFMLAAARRWISWPAAVEPVNESASTSECSASADPASASPVTTFKTPAGIPASSASSASASAVIGASGAGLWTTVLPQARAGAIFHEAIVSGKFHGVMTAQTPSGSRTVHVKTPAAAGLVVPRILVGQPA